MIKRRLAYFSMEIALQEVIPTYSGGFGVLAGDTVRSAADLGLSMVAITLLYRKGYFRQRLDEEGWQHEDPSPWTVETFLKELPERVAVSIEGCQVQLRAWQYEVKGIGGKTVPVYFLDADLPENAPADRELTHQLYGGDLRYRLCQELILGIGGVRMLRSLGHNRIERFHMNEGHAALLTVELLDELLHADGRVSPTKRDLEHVRKQCVFTTHTPVPAGHDQFALALATQVLQRPELGTPKDVVTHEGVLSMTHLALNMSNYINGVAKKHGEISRLMFSEHKIAAITNGVHVATWTSPPFAALYDRYIPEWREDNFNLRYVLGIPPHQLWEAHRAAKAQLLEHVHRSTAHHRLDPDVLTIGFARRAATYKRGELLLHDVERLKRINASVERFQVIYAGKAHPADQPGKELIQRIIQAAKQLHDELSIVYLENYDIELAKLLVSGCDLWLNTPQPPLEASGTSGMKAALNGVPSLSTLDGWWVEGCIEGVTGWSIGEPEQGLGNHVGDPERAEKDAVSLYDKLERIVLPLFYRERPRFLEVMRHTIALNGSFFNTQRMVQQYVLEAYFT